MLYCLVSDMAFLELGILLEKAGASLDCIREDSECQRAQTLAEIASDYLSAMNEMITVMQENRVPVPASPY